MTHFNLNFLVYSYFVYADSSLYAYFVRAGSSVTSLLADGISIQISCAGIYMIYCIDI